MAIKKTPIEFKFLEYNKDKREVTDFLEKNDSYLIYQDGKEVNEETATEVFHGELPVDKSYDDKQIIGFYQDETFICIVDILKNYPRKDTWVIGLMLLDERKRGQYIGKKIYKKTENYMLMNGVKVIRLGVLEDNEVGKLFWKKNGFMENGESKMHFDGRKILVCEKLLTEEK